MNPYLKLSNEVAAALAENKPVVALESTIISHGMPYPQNVETAKTCEAIIRENGAVPATCAILGGKLCVGLEPEQLEYLGKAGQAVTKASRRDIARLVASGQDGATTVAATMILAHMAGVRVFATGGIGGVHRGAETTMDISADLEELGRTPVAVVCAGAKSILDLGLTLEYLETKGVPVYGYQTLELPAFYTRTSGFQVDCRMDTPEEDGSRLYQPGDPGRRGGGKPPRRPWQGHHPLPAGQDQGHHRGQEPGEQHRPGIQQRPAGCPDRRRPIKGTAYSYQKGAALACPFGRPSGPFPIG